MSSTIMNTRLLRAVAGGSTYSKKEITGEKVYYLPVIDCSQSMQNVFTPLCAILIENLFSAVQLQENIEVLNAICFNHEVDPSVDPIEGLRSVRAYGKTNIIDATDAVLNKLNTVLSRKCEQVTVRILLVSDGDDTCHYSHDNFRRLQTEQTNRIRSYLQKNVAYMQYASVEATTIAVGDFFPTQSAMELQNAFATKKGSDAYIPPLFSIPVDTLFQDTAVKVMDEIVSYWGQPKRANYNIPMNVRMNWYPRCFPWNGRDDDEDAVTTITDGGFILVNVSPSQDAIRRQQQNDDEEGHQPIRIACQGHEVSNNNHGDAFELWEPQYLTKEELTRLLLQWYHALEKRVVRSREEIPTEQLQREAEMTINMFEHIRHVYKPPKTGKPKRRARDRLQQYRQLTDTNPALDDQMEKALVELRNIRDDVNYRRLTDRELQRRMEIGTRVGKYHRRLERQWGVDEREFKAIKEEFLSLLQTYTVHTEDTIHQQGKETQSASNVSLQSLRDVLTDETLKDAVQDCRDAYELVQTFPIVGNALSIHRTHASRIDPWLVQVRRMGTGVIRHLDTHTFLCFRGTQDLEDTNQEAYYKDPQTGETFNAVVPLLKDGDIELVPFVRSRLFQLLMTYNVCQTADAMLPQATMGLLGACFQYVLYSLDNDKSDFRYRRALLEDIQRTARMLIDDHHQNQYQYQYQYQQQQQQQPSYWKAIEQWMHVQVKKGDHIANMDEPLYQYFVSEAPSIPFKCSSLNKPLLAIAMAMGNVSPGPNEPMTNCLPEQKLNEIVMYWVAQFVYRAWKQTDFTDVPNELWSYLRDRWTFLYDQGTDNSELPINSSSALQTLVQRDLDNIKNYWLTRAEQLDFDVFPAHEDELLRNVETNVRREVKDHLESTVQPWLWNKLAKRMHEQYTSWCKYLAKCVKHSLPRVHGMPLQTINHWLQMYGNDGKSDDYWNHSVEMYALHATMLYAVHSGDSNLDFMQRVTNWMNPETKTFYNDDLTNEMSSPDMYSIVMDMSKRLVGDALKDTLSCMVEEVLTRVRNRYLDYMHRTHDEPPPEYFFVWDDYIDALKFDHPKATLSLGDIEENTADQRYMFKLPKPTGLQPFACQQPDCPLYMVPRHDIDAHLGFKDPCLDECGFPWALHVTAYYCAQDPNKGLDETLNDLRSGTYLVSHRGDPNVHERQRKCVDAHYDTLRRRIPEILGMYRRYGNSTF